MAPKFPPGTGPGISFGPYRRAHQLVQRAVIDYAVGPMQGKCRGDQALLLQLSASLSDNDLLLADALHSTWWAVHMLARRGVSVVMPHDGKRTVDFTQGRIHSSMDHVAWWPRPLRASWGSQEQYAQMPQGIWVREVKVDGRILMTTLLEPAQVSARELAALYAMRWNIEVDFLTLKADMHMDVFRCKSTAMVQKEIAVCLLTYTLVRQLMGRAAQLAGVPARQLSFTGA